MFRNNLSLLLAFCLVLLSESAMSQQVVVLKKTSRKQAPTEIVEPFARHYLQFNIGDNALAAAYTGMRSGFPHDDSYSYSMSPYSWFDSYTATYKSYWAAVPLTFSLQYFYAFKPWLHFGVDAYYAGEYWNISESGTQRLLSRECIAEFSLLPSLRFQYFNRPIVGIYSGLALGVFFDYKSLNHQQSLRVLPAWQLTFFGLRVGNRAFWTLELGAGCKGFFTTGVGVRF